MQGLLSLLPLQSTLCAQEQHWLCETFISNCKSHGIVSAQLGLARLLCALTDTPVTDLALLLSSLSLHLFESDFSFVLR